MYVLLIILIAAIVYFSFAIWLSKTVKRKVQAQTLDVSQAEAPPLASSKPYKVRHGKRLKHFSGSDLEPKEFGLRKRKNQTWITGN